MVPIYLLTHKKADVPLWSWAALSFKIPPTSGATSTYGMAVCGNADVGMLRVGFPIAPEKFRTVVRDSISMETSILMYLHC